jgi:hypothetical protein
MRIFRLFLFVFVTSSAALGAPRGVLENITKIQVDPTVVEHPDKIDDEIAASLVRYNLRAAIHSAHIEEGVSPVHAHIVLDGFSSESTTRKVLLDMGSGQDLCTVDGRLVIVDAGGKELANIKIHVHGRAVFADAEANPVFADGRNPTSDLERRLLREIEALK